MYTGSLNEAMSRQCIEDRVRRAQEPHLPAPRRRHRVAVQLRKLANRIDN